MPFIYYSNSNSKSHFILELQLIKQLYPHCYTFLFVYLSIIIKKIRNLKLVIIKFKLCESI